MARPKQMENTKGKLPKRRNVGKLMQILNVPVDVFLEIASHLHPLDLLHLSRASINLRETLMSRNMRTIWVAARKNVEPPMPDCPDGLSEPAYASLVFETRCMACDAGRATWRYSYAARVRFCVLCWKNKTKAGERLAQQIGIDSDVSIMSVIFKMLPEMDSWVVHRQNRWSNFHEPEFLALVDEYKKVQSEGAQALQEFVEKRTAETKARHEFDSAVCEWQNARSNAKDRLDRQAATDRATAIKRKLQELGYKPDDLPRGNSEVDKMLHQPRPLTTRIWNTIQPKLIKIVEAERARRAEEAFKKKWHSRLTALQKYYQIYVHKDRDLHPEKFMLPSFPVARRLPCIEALLTSVEDPQEELTEKQFASVEATFLQEVEAQYWIPSRHFLAQLVRNVKSETAEASSKGTTAKKRKPASTKRKGKGKHKDTDDDGQVDAAADSALLTSLASLFLCETCDIFGPNICVKDMTYKELLEHWQEGHTSPPWEADCIRVTSSSSIPHLLRALRLPADATLTDIEQRVWASSTTPTCPWCRKGSYRSPARRTLSLLLSHIHWDHRGPLEELDIDPDVESSAAAASTSRE